MPNANKAFPLNYQGQGPILINHRGSLMTSPILRPIKKITKWVLKNEGMAWINTVQHSEELICNIFLRTKGKEGIEGMRWFLSEVWINTVQHSEELICNIF